MTPVVVLVGPPGSGKTTVGELLAQSLGVPFRDTDSDVEATAGKAISEIFFDDGEPAFRRLEHEAVVRALTEHQGVLALGGGAVLDERTQEALAGHRVVFLDVGLTDAAARVGLNQARPLLLGNPRAQLKTLMEARRPVYERVSVAAVGTDGRTPDDIAAEILALTKQAS